MERLHCIALFFKLQPRRSLYTSSGRLKLKFPAYYPHRKATDPAKQDTDYYEKTARGLPLDDRYIDGLKLLYEDKTAYERDLRFKAEDRLISKASSDWLPKVDLSSPKVGYTGIDALTTASDDVKRIFSLGYGSRRDLSDAWKKALIDQVRKHDLDSSSLEMKIAWLTALIRHWSLLVEEINDKPRKPKWLNNKIFLAMGYRRKLLRFLRETDSEAFEKVLRELKIAYQVPKLPEETVEKRRKAWVEAQLTERVEKEKEAQLAELYEKYLKDNASFDEKAAKRLNALNCEEKQVRQRLSEIAEMQRGFKTENPPKYQPHLIGHLSEFLRHSELFYHPPPRVGTKNP